MTEDLQKVIGGYFEKKLLEWQEAYMDGLVREYIQLLSDSRAPSEKFWNLESASKKISTGLAFAWICDGLLCWTTSSCY